MSGTGAGGGYGAGRDSEEQLTLKSQIDAFVARYRQGNPPKGRKIIILFPGGMGSRLMRATTSLGAPPPFEYRLAWLACSIAWGGATYLQMQGDEDYKQFYVVPEGAVDLVVLNPYEGFMEWCQQNEIDLFIFGWDWRRSVWDTVTFFLDTFLPTLKDALGGTLENYTLIGHSQGGMVVKAIANQTANPFVRAMQCAITVAAPFYGYLGHVPRFFNGDPDLNWTEGSTGASKITQIVSSMSGAYELLCLEKATYDDNEAAFKSDPEGYNLPGYPSMDANTTGEAADPYNPVPSGAGVNSGGLVRYMGSCGFNWQMLSDGRNTIRQISLPLAPTIANKFYCIRGVQTSNGHDLNETVVSQTWKRVPTSFNADTSVTPFKDTMGPGDGTQPAWTARLLGLPAGHVVTVRGDLEHMVMMNEPSVHQAIGEMIGVGMDMVVIPKPPAVVASRASLDGLLANLQALSVDPNFVERDRQKQVRAYLQQFTRKQRLAFLARAFIDALKSPSQKIGRRPERDK